MEYGFFLVFIFAFISSVVGVYGTDEDLNLPENEQLIYSLICILLLIISVVTTIFYTEGNLFLRLLYWFFCANVGASFASYHLKDKVKISVPIISTVITLLVLLSIILL